MFDPTDDELVANRRQLIRLAVQRRPEITVAGLHRTLTALDIDTDEEGLLEDLAALDITVQYDAAGAEALGGPGMAKLVSPGASEREMEVAPPPLREQFRFENPAVIAASAAGAVLLVILIGILVFRDPGSGSADPSRTPGSTSSGGNLSSVPPATKPTEPRVAPAGPGADPLLVDADTVVDKFDRSVEGGLGTLDGVGIYLVGAGSWRVADGTAQLTEGNPGGTSVVFADVKTADARAQITLVDATQGAGIAFRVVDRKNYWLWTASPDYATCTLIQVIDGKPQIRGNSGITTVKPGMRLGVNTAGQKVELLANGTVVLTVNDATPQPGTGIGIGADARTATAQYDDFLVLPG